MPEPHVADPRPSADARRPPPAGAHPAIAAAWTVTALASALPAIVCTELLGRVPSSLWAAQVGVTVALLVAAFAWRPLRPLRRFAIVMAAFLLLLQTLPLIDLTWQPLQALFGATAFDERMQAEQTGKLIVTLAMIGLLLLLGYRRRDFFLAVGGLKAPIRPVRILGFRHADSWRRVGLIWGFGIAGALAVVQ